MTQLLLFLRPATTSHAAAPGEVEECRGRGESEQEAHAQTGTHFTCLTGTKVQILTQHTRKGGGGGLKKDEVYEAKEEAEAGEKEEAAGEEEEEGGAAVRRETRGGVTEARVGAREEREGASLACCVGSWRRWERYSVY